MSFADESTLIYVPQEVGVCVCSKKDSFYYFVKLNNVRFYGVFSGISARTRKRINCEKKTKITG